MTTAEQRVPVRRAGSVEQVLRRMRAVGSELPHGDGVAVFNRVYLRVTDELEQRLAGEPFAAAEASSELAVRFAGRYLAAVEDRGEGRRAPACWRPLLQSRGHPGVLPVQFALSSCRN